jgi:UDP-N-acetylglucosamine--N-acetylmuramyl-(pentapeptide) pyrophosphoryl-undecaprenol N-acetylglucosamine transferase
VSISWTHAQPRKILKEFRPARGLGVGGYASGPVVLAARGMQIRRFIHEQNAIPGMTNKVLARFAEEVFISLDESQKFFPKGKTLTTGNPVRREILDSISPLPGGKGQVEGGIFRLLSSAAASSPQCQPGLISASASRGCRDRLVTHQTGENDLADARNEREVSRPRSSFIDDMAGAY